MQHPTAEHRSLKRQRSKASGISLNVGALIIRIGFWSPLYYIYNNEDPPPKKIKINNNIGNYLGPYITCDPTIMELSLGTSSLSCKL